MAGTHRWIGMGLLLASAALLVPALAGQDAAPAAPAAASTAHHKRHKAAKTVELPPMPAGPLSQLPMDQIPAAPAKVSFQGGLLTISAQNSTLGEILREVRQLTGADIEIPQGAAANERVIASLGPGAPRDVLVGLLNGSSFDYVMLGSSTDPTAVSSVILTSKSPASGETPQAATAAYQSTPEPVASHAWPPGARAMPPNPVFNHPPGAPQAAPAQDDSKDDEQDTADDSDDQAETAQPDANGANPNAAQEQPQPTDPNQPNAGPKTPEQILDMLRRQQPPGGPITAPPPPQQ